MRLYYDDRSPVSKAASKDMYESLLSRMYVFKVGSLHVSSDENEQRKSLEALRQLRGQYVVNINRLILLIFYHRPS